MYECNRKERFKCIQINKKEDYKDLIEISKVVEPKECKWYSQAVWFYKSEYGIDRTPIAPGDWLVFEFDNKGNLYPIKFLSNKRFHEEYSIIEEDESCFNV